MTDKIVVYTTCGSREEAEKIADALVKGRLAACVQLVPGVASVYHWQGNIEHSTEILMMIKSSRALFPQLQIELAKLHSYVTPEILALPVVDGGRAYLQWMDHELEPNGGSH